ncbi:reverse transcriptase domain-containing protein [Tanacetum coccineum]
MVVKITKQGYYWPSMHRDAAKIIQNCAQCKEQSMAKKAAGKNAIAAGSHSMKWVEAKPLTTINRRRAEKFAWEYIICRFGVPRTINSKEEKHFMARASHN